MTYSIRYLKLVFLNLFLCLGAWSSADEEPPITLTTLASHTVRFSEGTKLNDYLNGMVTFFKQDGASLPVTRSMYHVLLKGCVDRPEALAPYIEDVMGILETTHAKSLEQAGKAYPYLTQEFVSKYVAGHKKLLQEMRPTNQNNARMMTFASVERDLEAFMSLMRGGDDPLGLRLLLTTAFFEQALLGDKITNGTFNHLVVSPDLIAGLSYTPDWNVIFTQMSQPGVKIEELVLANLWGSHLTPMMTFQKPLVALQSFYTENFQDYPFPAVSFLLEGLMVYVQTGRKDVFSEKSALIEKIYTGNSIHQCAQTWTEMRNKQHPEQVFQIFQSVKEKSPNLPDGMTEMDLYFLSLTYYTTWFVEYFFQTALGHETKFPQGAFHVAFSAKWEIESDFFQGKPPLFFVLTPESVNELKAFSGLKNMEPFTL